VDKREQILARLLEICAGISGIAAAARNVLDVSSLVRPAMVVQDGSEEQLDSARSDNRSGAQRFELTPQIWLLVRGAPANVGPLMSLYRSRLVYLVATDATLRDLTGTFGGIRYDGCTVSEPTPETKEPRMDVNFTLIYTLAMSDLEVLNGL